MTAKKASALAWSMFGATLLIWFASMWLAFASGPAAPGTPEIALTSGQLHVFAFVEGAFVVFSLVGALIASRQPDNGVGWLFCLTGLYVLISTSAQSYEFHALISNPGSLPGGAVAGLISDSNWLPGISVLSFLFLLFPTGHLTTRAEHLVFRLTIVGIISGFLGGLFEKHLFGISGVANPLGVHLPGPFVTLLSLTGFVVVLFSIPVSAILLFLRFRRSAGEERQQMKWFAFSAIVAGALFLLPNTTSAPSVLAATLAGLGVLLLPVSVAIAIFKYRLWDMDVVISKTVVFGVLAAFITIVYVGIVVGVGAFFGQGDKPNVALSIVATAIVAVAFQPVRERVQKLANRLVYGKRATPYEVLAEFSEQVAGAVANEEVLPQTARVLAEGTGATRGDVWRRTGPTLIDAASWPATASPHAAISVSNGELPAIPEAAIAVPVLHRGEFLGALSIEKTASEAITPAEEKLIDDLASQAGLVLRNVGLTTELEGHLREISAQAEELRASRQRIIAAQDAERRRLERNIHDGAQQHLVALAVKLRLAKTISASDPAKSRSLLEELQGESAEALTTLRDLARGIYPPLLEEKGLAEALRAQARKSTLPVRVEAAGSLARFPIDLETAAYFCCLEAVQNASKSAAATEAVISLADAGGDLAFSVSDDGVGFDPAAVTAGTGLQNMRDRVEALGGTLRIESTPGSGTTVAGSIPSRELEPAQ